MVTYIEIDPLAAVTVLRDSVRRSRWYDESSIRIAVAERGPGALAWMRMTLQRAAGQSPPVQVAVLYPGIGLHRAPAGGWVASHIGSGLALIARCDTRREAARAAWALARTYGAHGGLPPYALRVACAALSEPLLGGEVAP